MHHLLVLPTSLAFSSFAWQRLNSQLTCLLIFPPFFSLYSAQAGPITCGKPIMRSTVPSLCSIHFQKAQKNVTRALKKAGLNVSTSSKLASNFHVIVAEYVRQIQAKRRSAKRVNRSKVVVKEEIAGWASCLFTPAAWVILNDGKPPVRSLSDQIKQLMFWQCKVHQY